MKKISVFILLILFIPVNIFSQEFTQTADGIEHAKLIRKIKDEPVNVNLLRLDLTKVRLDVVHALDAAVGLETTSSIARRHGAIAAINAGFFKMDGLYKGDAAGILKIDNWSYSESFAGRVALLISNTNNITKTEIERLDVSTFLTINKRDIKVGENRQIGSDDVVIYTKIFHRTTLTNNEGVEFIIKKEKVRQIIEGRGSNEIPHDGYVLSATGKEKDKLLKLLKIGTKIKMWTTVSSPIYISPTGFYGQAEDIVGGVPQLIKNGKLEITWEQEKIGKEFVETRHPRTAVAKLKDGKFLMVTVDGRQPNVSVGMSLNELAEMLLELGAVEAMNLDGGGSTTMFVKDKVVNLPSDKTGERPVSDAILVTLRK